MLDAIINVLVEKLVEVLLNEGSHVVKFHGQFKTLKKELLFVQSYLKDAEKVRMKDRKETLKTTVQELREVLYDAEDIISDCKLFLEPERRKMPSKYVTYFSPSYLKFRYQMGKKLSEINKEIRDLREKMISYLPTTPTIPNQEQFIINRPVRYPVILNNAELVGLDDDTEKIICWLLEGQGPLNVIGMVGMGGIGKTTLAQKIRNNSNVIKHFGHVLMVTVSQTFKFEELVKNMLRKLNVDKDLEDINPTKKKGLEDINQKKRKKDLEDMDILGLLEELHERLNEEVCLIILDDVWSIDEGSWWESLKSVCPQGNGSCVIVTTRHEQVARSMRAAEMHIHRPKLLSDKDSWSLFTKIAFIEHGGQCPNPELERIGREIVCGCKGLPLAIKVVGGMMQGKGHSIDEWGRISENLKEELAKKGESIFSVLEVSYRELPSHLKPCMLCLAVFPEDYQISSDNVILWWIGEGFVREQGDDKRTAYEIGQEYIDELISRSLLLGLEMGYFGSFSIHDMIRDMIRVIAKEENFICVNDERGRPSCTQSRRFGMVKTTDIFREVNFKSLRMIVGINVEANEFLLNLRRNLCQLKWLRVLDISFEFSSEVDWLSGIGSLQHIVYIRIKNCGIKSLPYSIRNLPSLQTLYLENWPNLKRLPRNVAFQIRLTGCRSLDSE